MGLASLLPASKPNTETFDREWRSCCRIAEVERGTIDAIVRQEHYLKCWPAMPTCALAMLIDLEIVGACVFAIPNKETSQRYGGLTWELARLWISDDVPRNAETWFIGKAVRHIRREHRDVEFLVSYADPAHGHTGLIYRAANWKADGITEGRGSYLVNGKKVGRWSRIPKGAAWSRLKSQKPRFVLPLHSKFTALTGATESAA